jgi:hypothetical protein
MRSAFIRLSISVLFAATVSTSVPTLAAAAQDDGFTVQLHRGTAREKEAEQQFRRVTTRHDLTKWVQTKAVLFEEGAIPHSDPILTLNTRHLADDGLFISTFIHEQMHWWLDKRPQQTAAAVNALKSVFPTLPVGYPDGAESLDSSYEHLLVIWLELDGVRRVLGDEEEARVLHYWAGDHYKALYNIVKNDRAKIGLILKNNDLQI